MRRRSDVPALAVWIIALSSPLGGEQLPLKSYSAQEGLAHDHINGIIRDSRSFLWVATDEGLSRFDGLRFVNFTVRQGLPHPHVNAVIETRDGEIWLGTDGGLARLRPTGEPVFDVYRPNETPMALQVNAITEGLKGEIWCATSDGVFVFDPRTRAFTPVELGAPPEGNHMNKLLVEPDGTLWASSFSGLYRRTPDGAVRRFTHRDGLPTTALNLVARDREGRVWTATRSGGGLPFHDRGAGLARVALNPGPGQPAFDLIYTQKDGLPSGDIRAFLQASDGVFWIGHLKGLSRLQGGGAGRPVITTYTGVHGLVDERIYTLFEDRDRALWIGTNHGGIMRLALDRFITYGLSDGYQSNSFQSMVESADGQPCVIAGDNLTRTLYCFTGDRMSIHRLPFPPGTEFGWGYNQWVVVNRMGDWWIPIRVGLYRIRGAPAPAMLAQRPPEFVRIKDLPSHQIGATYEDSRGDLWITGAGSPWRFARWERATGRVHKFGFGLGRLEAESRVRAFREDRQGAVWIGFRDGVSLLRHYEGRFTSIPFRGSINDLFLDQKGRLWIGTSDSGLGRLDDPTAPGPPQIIWYTVSQGLSSDEIWCITEDNFGRIYAATGRGVDCLDPDTNHVRHFSTGDGLASGNVRAAMRDRNGALWFASNTGISKLIPRPDAPEPGPPTLILGVSSTGVDQTVSRRGTPEVRALRLLPNQNLAVEYVALGRSLGAKYSYQYRLGADHAWSPPIGLTQVNFAGLSPGSHRFEVRALLPEGSPSPLTASVEFYVIPPVWRTWWFLLMGVAAVCAGVLALHRARVQRALEMERVRVRIATDLHDDIGASLSQIAILGELAQQALRVGVGDVSALLTRITGASRDLLASMGDIVWAINPRCDSAADLEQRLRRFVTDTATPSGMTLTFDAPETNAKLALNSDIRREVLLVTKEVLNNAIRHSYATRVDVRFCVSAHMLSLTVTDNGRGYDTDRTTPGNGLGSMQLRAKRLAGELFIRSGQAGTEVELRVPVH